MVGWHHQLSGHELEQTLGDSEGQESLACCSPWGCRESDTTERLTHLRRIVCRLHKNLKTELPYDPSRELWMQSIPGRGNDIF